MEVKVGFVSRAVGVISVSVPQVLRSIVGTYLFALESILIFEHGKAYWSLIKICRTSLLTY